jgi:arylsulfatase A-like enzyme
MVNSGYESMKGALSANQELINKIQDTAINHKGGTRYDQLTLITAKEYMSKEHPKLIFIGLGETDEYAHARRYDLYVEQANKIDRMIADLWHWIQTTPGYKDNTNILITTDHGRGSRDSKWGSHSSFISGSSQTWIALMGPGIKPLGEMSGEQQIYQWEIAGMISGLMGEEVTKH